MNTELHEAFASIGQTYAALEKHLILDPGLQGTDEAFGYRFILGINKWVVDRYMIGSDRLRPRFVKYGDEFSKWGFSNPDNAYWIAEIAGDQEYIIRGKRGSAADMSFEIRSGIGRLEDDTHSRNLSIIDVGSLVLEPDGSFAISVGGEPKAPNHLAAGPDARVAFARQTFGDWDREEAGVFWIENVADVPPEPAPSAALVAEQLSDIARFLGFLGKINRAQGDEFQAAMGMNAFPAPKTGLNIKSAGGLLPGQVSIFSQYDVPKGQALVVSLKPPACRYLGFNLTNTYWFAPLDFENRQASLNLAQAHRSSDGLVHFVVSSEDPGVPNWMDCSSSPSGLMSMRGHGLRDELEQPVCHLMPLTDVRSVLPANEPQVTAQERAQVLRRRRAAIHRRYF